MQTPYLDAMQGDSEEWTELYLTYCEEVPQLTTQQGAKSFCGIGGLAGKQAKALRSLE